MDLLSPFSFLHAERLSGGAVHRAADRAAACFLVLKGWSLMATRSAMPRCGHHHRLCAEPALIIGPSPPGCSARWGGLSGDTAGSSATRDGVGVSGMFGLGMVLYTKIETDVHLDHISSAHLASGRGSVDRRTGGVAVSRCVLAKWKTS